MHPLTLLTLATPALSAALTCRSLIRCPLIFDGRIPSTAVPTDFDTPNGGGWNPFNPSYVKGNNLLWSDILLLPSVPASRFDAAAGSRAVEVTISDESIFMSQRGFRRAGLQFAADANTGSPGGEGAKTLHFSVRQDAQRPLNLTHEYLTGTIIGQPGLPEDTFKLLDRENRLVWSTPMATDGSWQNFALTLDFDQNTIQVWYSANDEPLQKSGDIISADLAGQGQYQIGMLKKPTGTDDVVNSGYQESGLDEGQIYGGIFIEDSADGCVSV
ncbi:hypothetical protein CGMCC3_g9383 [Colletotrichum fructicola]|nr:uncharacterized protein CGMCC3_g9383 [Colletotrichum fructicola]KAE9574626.1 hypothetical protein CGMCC3_g9383 [Colletotrichum fructicola]KAF4432895.1 hypothetical protein CFRS1_v007825 [Colletotrichum fructicola]